MTPQVQHMTNTLGMAFTWTARLLPGSGSWTARLLPGSPTNFPTPTSSPRGWHSRNYLPHFDDGLTIQHIIYRLADALPRHVLYRMQAQCEELKLNDETKAHELKQRIEDYIDAGHGSCILQEEKVARIVIQAWQHFDGKRYRLLAWVVMPNHTHVLIQPLGVCSLSRIVASWKSFTGRWISEWKKSQSQAGAWRSGDDQAGAWRSGERIWQREYWDRYIRNEQHYWIVKDYIENNPVKAGLVEKPEEWPWSSAAIPTNHKDTERSQVDLQE